MFRFVEIANKRVLFHLAKSAAVHQLFFTVGDSMVPSSIKFSSMKKSIGFQHKRKFGGMKIYVPVMNMLSLAMK